MTARRLPVPTPRLLRVAAVLAVLGAVVPMAPALAVAWTAAVTLAGALVLVDLLLRPTEASVAVRRDIPPLCHVGRDGAYEVSVRNLTAGRLAVRVRDVLPVALEGEDATAAADVPAGGELRQRVAFTACRRGRHRLAQLGVGLSRGLGLVEQRLRVDHDDHVAVAPGRPAGEVSWLLARASVLAEVGERASRRRGSDWEFESLREYVVGDELRYLDWKASARRHRPMVRQYQQERNAELVLALDCGRLMGTLVAGVRKVDLAMTPLLDVAAVALRRGERVGLLAFDARPRAWLPPRAGLPQLHAMTEALAVLPEDDEPTSHVRAVSHLEARHRRRALVVVFTDFTDELSARDMYASLGALARRHSLVFVGIADPHLDAVFDARDTGERALFERAAAGSLLVERRRTLERIERMGVTTLDAEPRRLSGPLIARYLEARRTT